MSPARRSPRVVVLPGAPRLAADVAVALGIRKAGLVRDSARAARRLDLDLAALVAAERAGTRAGDVTKVPAPDGVGSVLLVGVGDGTPRDLRAASAALARGVRHASTLVTTLGASTADAAEAVAEGLLLGTYRAPREGLTSGEGASPLTRIELWGGHDEPAVRRGLTAAAATVLARDLANTRSNVKGPAWLAARASTIARASGLDVEVWTPTQLRRDGFGALLAVGGGAERGPRLVRLGHRPTRPQGPHVVLVGKGITFDTGGISLKPREAMLGMNTDMTGSAVVLAVLQACAELDLPVRVTGLMAIAENSIGAGSYRPGDVVRTYDGTTVEIRNTDAEGRLVLADAMGYARRHLNPDVMIDIATLTGAASQGLGRSHAAMYTTYPSLGRALERAGERSGERVWQMPLVEDYRASIDSDVADICQISTRPAGNAGSIVAALFLREFAGDVPWAHLDIAGPGRSDRDRAEISRGGTGWGARLLLAWLQTL